MTFLLSQSLCETDETDKCELEKQKLFSISMRCHQSYKNMKGLLRIQDVVDLDVGPTLGSLKF